MRHFLFMLIVTLSFAIPAYAIDSGNAEYRASLQALNSIRLSQNPQLSLSKKFIDRKIVDGTGSVIGKADDIALGTAGEIIGIKGRFKLGGSGNMMTLDTSKTGITVTNTSFTISLTSDVLSKNTKDNTLDKSVFKKEDDKPRAVYVSDLLDGTVETAGGHKIGKITDVAFNKFNTDLYALIVKVGSKDIALPAQPYMLKTSTSKPVFLLTDEQALTLDAFIKTK